MNSDTRRVLSQIDTHGSPTLFQNYADGLPLFRERVSSPSALLTLSVVFLTIAYHAAYRRGRLPPLPRLICDLSLFLVPARLLFAIDRFIHPPLFPTPMVGSPPDTPAAKREALRRILGIGHVGGDLARVPLTRGTGFLSSLSDATLGSTSTKDQPPGLGNYDNSCFQNSILQSLASVKPLSAYLSAICLALGPESPPMSTVETLRDFLDKLNGTSNNGKTLWVPRVLKNMNTWQQQDAQEYYSKLLAEVDSELAKSAPFLSHAPRPEPDGERCGSSNSQHSSDSGYQSIPGDSNPGRVSCLVRNPLEGFTAQRVVCVNCGYSEGLSLSPFNCLTLTLGDLPVDDLRERLDHFTKVESIQNVQCLKCTVLSYRDALLRLVDRGVDFPQVHDRLRALNEALEEEDFDEKTLATRCHIPSKDRASSTKTKQVAVARAPQSLVLHVNRSRYDENYGFMFKNTAAVRFPMKLDLGPWCLGSADDRDTPGEEPAPAQDVEQWTLNPKTSMVAGSRQPSKITGPIYELRAVVTHYGHHENGHYICYRRHPVADEPCEGEAPRQGQSDSRWWRLSDHEVTPVDEEGVLAQGGAFMLFYDRVDHDLVLVSALDELVGKKDLAEEANATGRDSPASSPVLLDLGEDGALADSDSAVHLAEAPPSSGSDTAGSEWLPACELSETLCEHQTSCREAEGSDG